MKKIMTILAIAAMSAACQQEMNDGMNSGAGQGTVLDCLPATLSVESTDQTKTSLVNSGDDAGNILWSEGDAISAFIGTDGNSKYTLDSEDAGSTTGTFTQISGVVGTAMDGNILLYPYNADATASMSEGAATVNFNLPATQAYKADSFESGAFPMIAVSESVESFGMKNILGLLEVALHCEFAASVSKIEFIADVPVCGAASVTASVDGEPSLVLNDAQSKTVTLNCATPVALSNDKTKKTKFYIALPAQQYEGFTLKVYDTNGYQMIETTSNTLDLKRSKVKTVSLEYIIDLHAKGHANCYMVTPATFCKYRFDATVIGNGAAGLIAGAHTESVNIAPKSAKLLYKVGSASVLNTTDNQAAVKTSSVSLDSKGRITFNSPSGTNGIGNAVIAVYSEENCTGDILWTWHIWKPEETVADQKYSSTYTLMDRNLGACTKLSTDNVNASSGAYYQWGRKDPFYTNANSGAITVKSTQYTIATSPTAIGTAVGNPATFYANNNGTSSDWLTTANNALWGTNKTIYDPCPAGYRVADQNAFKDNLTTLSATSNANHVTYVIGNLEVILPMEGAITYGAGERTARNTEAYVWNAAVNSGKGRGWRSYADSRGTISMAKAYGYPVRCQKIK